MKMHGDTIIALLALVVTTISAQPPPSHDVNITALLELPQCIQDCGLEFFPQFNCTPQQECYCETTGPLSDALAACAISTCPSLADALAAQKFQADTCGFPLRDKSTVLGVVPYTLFGIATLSLVARFLSRWPRMHGAGFSYDDYMIVLSYIPVIGVTLVAYYEVYYGSGTDMWERTIDELQGFLLWFYIAQPLYLTVTCWTKVSLLLLYLRIWPPAAQHATFRKICWIVLGLLLATWIATTLPTVLACRPISYSWNNVVGETGVCLNRQDVVYAHAALNIAFDCVVLLLPLPRLLRLRVSTGEKIGISACFLVGFIVTACSITRLTQVQGLQASRNVTWDFAPAGLWSLVEVYCSLICCCMPAMAGLVKRSWRYARNKPLTYASDPSKCGTELTETADLQGWKVEGEWRDGGEKVERGGAESRQALVERTESLSMKASREEI